ncbi:MAG: excinuclease ABC subunit UvrB [Simkaniaceae bacterium]|nr:excinuclease ABC subunit UvrB [Simkaniaceae bacterium]
MFRIETSFEPCGDQPEAIRELSLGLKEGKKSQVLLGVTGSGKTFTMANLIAQAGRPTLILAHNKTLAGQLYQEFKSLFPYNAVEYFVSYYDYYQPEAYVARTDTYIEKDLAINDQIDRLRLSATRSLLERRDVIIVSSVSCIYGLGLPEYYKQMRLTLNRGGSYRRDEVLLHLIQLHYDRNDFDLMRSTFRVRGDILEIVPAYEDDLAYRVEFFGDEVERISEIDPLTGQVFSRLETLTIYPASHHVTPEEARDRAILLIEEELSLRETHFKENNQLIEAQRIRERTRYDLEMIKEIGFCKGVENYSRHFGGRQAGEPAPCLINYFPDDFLLFIDESHQTLPQLHAMYNGDRARKASLIEFGFRLPSAFDNRPLQFKEFYEAMHQVIYVSATPGAWEVSEAGGVVVQQVIRPTGLLDPKIEIRSATRQIDDVLEEIRKEKGRVLITTLTKRLSEDLTKYLEEIGVKAKYLHSDIDTIERMQIIQDLRQGRFDVLVGINLLREGLDIPEVALVMILDADKEGFLRSRTALIQTCGRAARNVRGRVIMYADKITDSMQYALDETKRRRVIQEAYNQEHGIEPKSIVKKIDETFMSLDSKEEVKRSKISMGDLEKRVRELTREMKKAAKEFRFEEAAHFRDEIKRLQALEMA